MEVILLERIAKLGQMGDVVRVRDGFARNFLLPQGKALRATSANKSKFESMKAELQAKSAAAKSDADKVASQLDGQSFNVIRQASEAGQLYGSVSPRDIASLLNDAGYKVSRNQVALNVPIKTIGSHKVPVQLHPDVEVTITLHVARSADEAERLARGEDILVQRTDAEQEQAEALASAEAFFEPGAVRSEDDQNDENNRALFREAGITPWIPSVPGSLACQVRPGRSGRVALGRNLGVSLAGFRRESGSRLGILRES
jgi:large subunit ribosomal protein L9